MLSRHWLAAKAWQIRMPGLATVYVHPAEFRTPPQGRNGFPGIEQPFRVKGFFQIVKLLKLDSVELSAHGIQLLDPDTMLASDGAPCLSAQSQDFFSKSLRFSSSPGTLESYMINGWRLPSPGMKHVCDRQLE